MIAVNLPPEDWQRVLAILSQAPWHQVNGLIMSIGEQLRVGSPAASRGLHNDGVVNQAGPPNGADRNP